MRRSTSPQRAGFSLVELLVAAGVLLTAAGGIYVLAGQCIDLVKQARNSSAANQFLQERADAARMQSFSVLLSSTNAANKVLGTAADSEIEFRGISNFKETMLVSVLTGGTGSYTVSGTRSSAGVPVVSAASTTLSGSSRALRLTLSVEWNDRVHASIPKQSRTYSTVVANGGVSLTGIDSRDEPAPGTPF